MSRPALWDLLIPSRRRPAPAPPRPDYARIERLERDLGLVEERPIRPHLTVCLTKQCTGDTEEIRTWSSQLVRHIHLCETVDAEDSPIWPRGAGRDWHSLTVGDQPSSED